MELFVTKKPLFEKIAALELEEDPSQWPRQVLTELFRELPEITEYTPEVKFLKFDEEKGYAMGVVVVKGDTQTALSSSSVGDVAPTRCFIPVIIKDGKLCPMDVVMTTKGKMLPLTPERLREVMYRPEGFNVVTEDWNDTSIWGLFHPPGRSDANYASGISQGIGGGTAGISYIQGPGMKMAMLESIADTLLEPDVMKLASLFVANPEYLQGHGADSAFLRGLKIIGEAPALTPEKVASMHRTADLSRGADVAQFSFDELTGTYLMKIARREEGTVSEIRLTRGEMLKIAEADLTRRVDTAGVVTASTPSKRAVVITSGEHAEQPRVIEGTSLRSRVHESSTGEAHEGVVFVSLVDGTGSRLPLSVFVGENAYSIQEQIAGSRSEGRKPIPSASVSGRGLFFWGDEWCPTATVPVVVKGSATMPSGGGVAYTCVDFTGMPLTVKKVEGLQDAIAFPDLHELHLPADARFVQMKGKEVDLISNGIKEYSEPVPAPSSTKYASSRFAQGGISVFPAGDGYVAQYHMVPKLASLFGTELDGSEAVFMLCTAGLSTLDADAALRKVARDGRCDLFAADVGEQPAVKVASSVDAVHALRQDLVKEAAAVMDSTAVDAVLSLGFINSENVRTFIAQIPYLESALSKLCELTMASRLGLAEIPEAAASRGARGLDAALKGLKALALREISELS